MFVHVLLSVISCAPLSEVRLPFSLWLRKVLNTEVSRTSYVVLDSQLYTYWKQKD